MCGAPAQTAAAPADSGGTAGRTVVTGTVQRAGAPVAGAYVRLLDPSGEFTAEVVTSEEGVFRFFTAPGEWTVRALIPGASSEIRVSAVEGVTTESEILF